MNYRHAFHAGNFADVFKHVMLARILVHLREKAAPFRVIDTHAGAGLYDLSADDANRTGEWRDGIGRLAGSFQAATVGAAAAELIAPYLAACRDAEGRGPAQRLYPGSPVIAAQLLRPQDRLIACELEPAAAAALARNLRCKAAPRGAEDGARAPLAMPGAVPVAMPGGVPALDGSPTRRRAPGMAPTEQVKVLRMDGWTALNAYVPPKERRGLVLIDPPYERPDDFARLADGINAAHRKWPSGIYMLWYPVKSREGPDHLARALRCVAPDKRLRAEIAIATAQPQSGLSACGVIVLNPPWKLAAELGVILPALCDVLGRDAGRCYALDRLEAQPRAHRRPGGAGSYLAMAGDDR
jgi:23S rRNA (adenine2030-N6)-methyltransferase